MNIKFTIECNKTDDASVLIKRIARTHNFPLSYGRYGQERILIDDKFYAFDKTEHVFDIRKGSVSNVITVYLKRIKREPKKKYEVHRLLRCVDQVLVVDGFDKLHDAIDFLKTLKTPAHVVKIDKNGSVLEILKQNY